MNKTSHAQRTPARKSGGRRARRPAQRRWSRRATETSNALDLEPSVFTKRSARQVALSLKRSAMLNLYINRAGKNLTPERRRTLERAKGELRKVFRREPRS
jgi:hypothetical protein